jgi:hypothetical protein
MHVRAALTLLLAATCSVASADERGQLRLLGERVGPRALALLLEERQHSEGPRWRRHLLRNGYLPVEGSVREVGWGVMLKLSWYSQNRWRTEPTPTCPARPDAGTSLLGLSWALQRADSM